MATEMLPSEIERSLDNLFGKEGVKTLSHQRVASELERLVHRIETDFLASLKTATAVAELYQCSRQAINTRAARLRKQRGVFGWKFGKEWVFTPGEVGELEPGPEGRPRKTES